MDDLIIISNLNDFIFCPISIFFHNLYGEQEVITFQNPDQINGSHAHKRIDIGEYSTQKDILSGISVYSEKYNILGKIDVYDRTSHTLIERKRQIKRIYDGYVFQVYAQCFCLREMGYPVEKIRLHSLVDNKNYEVLLPEEDKAMMEKFEKLINDIRNFDMTHFSQNNKNKCKQCIYEPACDRGLKC